MSKRDGTSVEEKDYFRNPDFDEAEYLQLLEEPEPLLEYLIYFTPRSGSTWLGDLLRSTSKLGNPREWINPNFIPNVARSINAHDALSYFRALRRRQAPGRVFGVELTYFQLNNVFPDNARFLDLVRAGSTQFYLFRENIVLQAISLSKAVETGVFHSKNSTEDATAGGETTYAYDVDLILKWLEHLLSLENRFEAFVDRFGLELIRFTYEQMIQVPPETIVGVIAQEIGADVGPIPVHSAHGKLESAVNAEFADRFRTERPDVIRRVEEAREDRVLDAVRSGTQLFLR